jgi:hypothetical protein
MKKKKREKKRDITHHRLADRRWPACTVRRAAEAGVALSAAALSLHRTASSGNSALAL